MKKRFLFWPIVIGAGLWLASDDSGYGFCTQAIYEAPKMGFRIELIGAGVVKAGDDLSLDSSAIAMVCPSASTAKPVRLIRTGPTTAEYSVTDGESGVLNWNFRNKSKVLMAVFRSAGFGIHSDKEIAETMHVFENISFGPKGTTMPGQTQFLKAKSVDFQGGQCEEQTSSEWITQTSLTLDCSPRH